jgi:hypothetical protein
MFHAITVAVCEATDPMRIRGMAKTRLIVVLLAVLVLLSIARGIIVSMIVDGGPLENQQALGRRSGITACQSLQTSPPASRPNLLN